MLVNMARHHGRRVCHLPRQLLTLFSSTRSVGYSTVSDTQHICHSDGTPQGSIVGLLVFSHSPSLTSTASVRGSVECLC